MSTSTLSLVNIMSMPVEILEDIAKLATHPHGPMLVKLRLVCKRFNEIILPLMFSRGRLVFTNRDNMLEMLKAYADGVHPSLTYGKSLRISSLTPPPWRPAYVSEDEERKSIHSSRVLYPYNRILPKIKELLPRAFTNLRKITSITWELRFLHGPDEWSREYIISGISEMPAVTKLALIAELEDGISVQLHSLPPLKELSVRGLSGMTTIAKDGSIQGLPELIAKSSTRLVTLEVATVTVDHSLENLENLFAKIPEDCPLRLRGLTLEGYHVQPSRKLMPHLQSLETLSLTDHSLYKKNQDMYKRELNSAVVADCFSRAKETWKLLMKDKIYLQEITLDEPNEIFLQYLRSYKGLKSLKITRAVCTSSGKSESLALDFFSGTLNTHVHSLETLDINPMYEDKWCFGEHNIQFLLNLNNLRFLSLAIIADSSTTENLWTRQSYMFNVNATRPASYKPFESSYDPSHAVCQLMQTATSLPRLERLTIRAARIASNRDTEDRHHLVHGVDADAQIRKHITSFGPLDHLKYRFSIEHREKVFVDMYSLQRGDDGEFWYRDCGHY